MLASQDIQCVELTLEPSLLEELCRSLNSRLGVHDTEFPHAFPAPGLQHLYLSTGGSYRDTEVGATILDILELRQSRLRNFTDAGRVGFGCLSIGDGMIDSSVVQNWSGLVSVEGGKVHRARVPSH